jgi:hypothetical protein
MDGAGGRRVSTTGGAPGPAVDVAHLLLLSSLVSLVAAVSET